MRDNPQLPSLMLAKLRSFASALDRDDDYNERSFPSAAMLYNASRVVAYSFSSEISLISLVLSQEEIDHEMEIHLIVDEEDPLLPTQVRGLNLDSYLWLVNGKNLVEHPESPTFPKKETPREVKELATKFADLGCVILEEYGTFRAEFRGVEVARIVEDANDGFQINVGVGDYDQNANSVLSPYDDPEMHLKEVLSTVQHFRTKKSPPHPLNRILRSRWLMSEAVSNIEHLDLQELNFVESLLPEHDPLKNWPCSAIGSKGKSVVLVLSATGIDLSLVPHAAGQISRHNPDELVLLTPEQDRHPVILRQARHLILSPEFISIKAPWPEFSENT